tara:strand:- start:15994 stop:16929 length:936 start_codon:yes stop_codon:yes gene_type:complete
MTFLRGIALVLLALLCAPRGAAAGPCTASVTDLNFGTVSVRAGAINQTSGLLDIQCSGLLTISSVCVHFGPGSGGAGGNNSPRYMRNALGSALAYELRPTGLGAAFGTLNTIRVPLIIGALGIGGSAKVPVYGQIVSNSVSVGSGMYASTFSGPSNISISYGMITCDLLGGSDPVTAFTVSADVVPSCEVDVTSMNFGTIPSALAGPVDNQATVNVRCTSDTSYSISLDNGTGIGVTGPTGRKLRNLGHSLLYGLYQNAARSMPWGDQPGTTVSDVGAGSNQAFTIYGRIFGGQNARVGVYQDSVVVTINY